MAPLRRRGTLKTWKDDRGFGFIRPDDDSHDVFLHISILKGMARRPKVGDIIFYESTADTNGKLRATKASIQGVASRSLQVRQHHSWQRHRQSNLKLLEMLASVVFVGIMLIFGILLKPSRSPSVVTLITQPGCVIKGNISKSSSAKYYHIPGMEDYDSTVIDQLSGERWFCTEEEATAQGWRKAPR